MTEPSRGAKQTLRDVHGRFVAYSQNSQKRRHQHREAIRVAMEHNEENGTQRPTGGRGGVKSAGVSP